MNIEDFKRESKSLAKTFESENKKTILELEKLRQEKEKEYKDFIGSTIKTAIIVLVLVLSLTNFPPFILLLVLCGACYVSYLAVNNKKAELENIIKNIAKEKITIFLRSKIRYLSRFEHKKSAFTVPSRDTLYLFSEYGTTAVNDRYKGNFGAVDFEIMDINYQIIKDGIVKTSFNGSVIKILNTGFAQKISTELSTRSKDKYRIIYDKYSKETEASYIFLKKLYAIEKNTSNPTYKHSFDEMSNFCFTLNYPIARKDTLTLKELNLKNYFIDILYPLFICAEISELFKDINRKSKNNSYAKMGSLIKEKEEKELLKEAQVKPQIVKEIEPQPIKEEKPVIEIKSMPQAIKEEKPVVEIKSMPQPIKEEKPEIKEAKTKEIDIVFEPNSVQEIKIYKRVADDDIIDLDDIISE